MISEEDRDEAEVPSVVKEVEIEAVEGQDEEDREDYEPDEADRNLLLEDGLLANITKKSNIEWHRTPYTPVNTWESPVPEPPEPLTPYGYFKQYVHSEMFQLMTTMTNICAEQNAVKRYKHASISKIEAVVGLHMSMGVLGLPRVRMYWSSSINISLFRDTLSRDRYLHLRSNLHVVNNNERPSEDTDVFYKVRPQRGAVC